MNNPLSSCEIIQTALAHFIGQQHSSNNVTCEVQGSRLVITLPEDIPERITAQLRPALTNAAPGYRLTYTSPSPHILRVTADKITVVGGAKGLQHDSTDARSFGAVVDLIAANISARKRGGQIP